MSMPFSDIQLAELKEFNVQGECLITLERTYNPVRVKYATKYKYEKDADGNDIIIRDADGKNNIIETATSKEIYDKTALWAWLKPELRPVSKQPTQTEIATTSSLNNDTYIFSATSPGTRGEVVEVLDVQSSVVKFFVEIFSKDASEQLIESEVQFIADWISAGGKMDGYIEGYSLLYLAAINNKEDLVKMLVALPEIDINLTSMRLTEAGMTPFFAAASLGHTGICRLLFDKGAKINQKQEAGPGFGYYPLFMAVQNSHLATTEFLLKNGADPNAFQAAREVKGWTALMIAVSNKNEALVALLLKNGADPNLACASGKYKGITPLLLAVSKGDENMITLLRLYGASADLEQKTGAGLTAGKTPITYAKHRWSERPSIVEALIHTTDILPPKRSP